MMVQVSTVTAKRDNDAASLEEGLRPFASIRGLVKAAFHLAAL